MASGETLSISSVDAWYFGHATPDELYSMAVGAETDIAWSRYKEDTIRSDEDAVRFGLREYRDALHGSKCLIDTAPNKVKLPPNGLGPVSEPYVESYLDKS